MHGEACSARHRRCSPRSSRERPGCQAADAAGAVPPARRQVRPAAPGRPRHRRAEQASTPCATSPSPAARSRWSPRSIPAAEAGKTIDVAGLYVTPGLIDIHAHVYAGTGERSSYAGDNSVYPDGFTLPRRRHDGGRRRRRRLAQLRGLQGAGSSIARRPASSPSSTSSATACAAASSSSDLADMDAKPTADDGAEAQGHDRRHQDRALRRARVDAGRARGRGRHRRQHPGDGGLRQQPSRSGRSPSC